MLRIFDISLPLDYNDDTIKSIICNKFKLKPNCIKGISLYRRSVDARNKNNIHFICTIDIDTKNEGSILNKYSNSKISKATKYKYELPPNTTMEKRPVVVGFGPAGIFCALILAQMGHNPIVLERGKDVDSRTNDVTNFWNTGRLNTKSNVQFGEGGAGTFSDGKLNTGVKDARSRKVLEEFVDCGAPKEILYLAKPHIGTDKLKQTVKNLRKKIISLGGEIRFESQLININTCNSSVVSVQVDNNGRIYEIDTDNVILAIGHSARDTFEMLFSKNILMEAKPFSVGTRIEHKRSMIDFSQYGKFANSPYLGAADYKMATHLENGRGVYTFCMCPGGTVVASSSEPGRLVTNGMSEFSRDEENSNSALLVGVNPSDFGSSHPLAGIEFQRGLEERAFKLGGENYNAPVQLLGDFLENKPSIKIGNVFPSYKPGYKLCNLSDCLPDYICDSMRKGIMAMDKKLDGFASYDAVLTAVETRSSSPVRITRDDTYQSVNIKGLYPCGEGAGYAGGIISAAIDGIKCAEMVINHSV